MIPVDILLQLSYIKVNKKLATEVTEDTELFIFSLCSRYNVFSVAKNW